MITIYLKEWDKEEELRKFPYIPKWAKKWLYFLIEKCNYMIVEKIEENRKIYLLPNIKKENIYLRIRKKLEKEKTKTQKLQLVLSNKIKPYQTYFKDYKIVTGKSIYLASLETILKTILQEEPLELQDIYLLTNRYDEKSIAIIKKIAPKVKTMNIITKEIEKYKILEEMLQEKGIMINVANNKKKSLKKAKIIINLNFPEEQLTTYSIFRNSIILNATQEKLIHLTGFNGIMIQDIQIQLEDEIVQWMKENKLENEFTQLEIYESMQDKKIDTNSLQIVNLYGNHGRIDEKELRNWQKILTNEKN